MLMRKPVFHLMVRMLLPPPPAWCKHHSGQPGSPSSADALGSAWKCVGQGDFTALDKLYLQLPPWELDFCHSCGFFWRVCHIRNCLRVVFAEMQVQQFSSPPLLCLCHMCSSCFSPVAAPSIDQAELYQHFGGQNMSKSQVSNHSQVMPVSENGHCIQIWLLTPGLKHVFMNVSWVKVFIHQNY